MAPPDCEEAILRPVGRNIAFDDEESGVDAAWMFGVRELAELQKFWYLNR